MIEPTEIEVESAIVLAMIYQDLQMWGQKIKLLTIRHRVNKRLNAQEGIAACEKELLECETAIDELNIIKAEVQAEAEAKEKSQADIGPAPRKSIAEIVRDVESESVGVEIQERSTE